MKFSFLFLATCLLCASQATAEDIKDSLKPFLERHCMECHDADSSEGSMNLAGLEFDSTERANRELWQRVWERVRDGEMPPAANPRPARVEAAGFLSALEKPLVVAHFADVTKNGRVQSRRLTRVEYENTLHDLLGIDIPLKNLLPEDPVSHGFETVAAGQQLSHFQLARYLDVADIALGNAFDRAVDGDKVFSERYTPELLASGHGRGNYRGPESRNGRSYSWPINVQFYGRMTATKVPNDGWYRITLRDVQAVNPGDDGAVWGMLRSGVCYANAPMVFSIGIVEATAKARDLVFEAWIQKDHILELKPNDRQLRYAKPGSSRGGSVSYRGRDLESEGCSGIAHCGIEIQRIYPVADQATVRQNLWGDEDPIALHKDASSSLTRIVASFAYRAFRRPVDDAQLAPYLKIGHSALANGDSLVEAIQACYRAILCSPRFLTFVEMPGELDQHAVASRLSYALWVSMPDDELLRLADEGTLRRSDVLVKQVDRMLADPKSDRFIRSFTDQWLNLKEIDATSPDEKQFRDFDPVVQESMVLETRAYIAELIRENLSVEHLIDSDFVFLNGRLARHYRMKVDLQPGDGLQKVALSPTQRQFRGGLVTQGAILKVTADGTSTSPVVRGVFVNERILGQTIPPPPPGIPAIEPDIRGASSIRDQLEKHRSNESCAACHRAIDPPGFVLENFDPVGGFRNNYGAGGNGVAVNPQGTTPDGKDFEDLVAWKAIYRERDEQLARGFLKQFLTYAIGAPVEFGDRKVVDAMVSQASEDDYGLRSIIHHAITSSVFLSK